MKARKPGTFAPGTSGNPSGRPKDWRDPETGLSIRELAQSHTGAALQTLVDVANDDSAPPSARVSAAQAILDRGHGKPLQSMELGGAEGAPLPKIELHFIPPNSHPQL
jgi:hypothetical protein